ncbi:hypothetical protein EJ08DRAFT_75527 [Tothia fuscella]|uniref:Uncharacterized protein n=1 Tax=Tothia fuscella TaxID=1048955 RepID=A0A9P4NY06_9PEZI|nr:hypothetical protein EJ08DRAFT_75527 [Tothia fuscella]
MDKLPDSADSKLLADDNLGISHDKFPIAIEGTDTTATEHDAVIESPTSNDDESLQDDTQYLIIAKDRTKRLKDFAESIRPLCEATIQGPLTDRVKVALALEPIYFSDVCLLTAEYLDGDPGPALPTVPQFVKALQYKVVITYNPLTFYYQVQTYRRHDVHHFQNPAVKGFVLEAVQKSDWCKSISRALLNFADQITIKYNAVKDGRMTARERQQAIAAAKFDYGENQMIMNGVITAMTDVAKYDEVAEKGKTFADAVREGRVCGDVTYLINKWPGEHAPEQEVEEGKAPCHAQWCIVTVKKKAGL